MSPTSLGGSNKFRESTDVLMIERFHTSHSTRAIYIPFI